MDRWLYRNQMVTEGLLLSGMGGLAGYAVGQWVSAAYLTRIDLGVDLPMRFDIGGGSICIEGQRLTTNTQPPASFINHVDHDSFRDGHSDGASRAFTEDDERGYRRRDDSRS